MSNFTITKTREYVWRIGPFGDSALSSHNHITCWHVEDESGNRIAGGHSQGSNCRSGEAVFARKKDAKAWADGYAAAEAGRVELKSTRFGPIPVGVREHTKHLDGQASENFFAGAHAYANKKAPR